MVRDTTIATFTIIGIFLGVAVFTFLTVWSV